MPENKPKPSLLRQLFEGGAFVPRGAGAFDVVRNINKTINSNLAENLAPYGYVGVGSPVNSTNAGIIDKIKFAGDATRKYVRAGVLGIKDPVRAEMEKNPSSQDMLRIDLLNMYAGKPQMYNSVTKSQYSPGTSKESGKTYYSSKLTENDLLSSMLDEDAINKLSKGVKSKKDLEAALSRAGQKADIGYQATMTGLGRATFDFGEDEKGPYISYYDKWDLNPLSGKSSAIKLGKAGDDFITGLSETFGATPPEVYGRIYFDKKTGKPIDPEARKVFDQAASNVIESKKEIKSTPGIVSSGFAGLKKKK
jgi:hypothetical protein